MTWEPIFVPDEPAPPVPLSPAVRAGDFVFVSGQVASREDGTVLIGSFEEEVRQAFANVDRILAAAEATRGDIVKVNAYLANSVLFAPFNDIYRELFPGARPARTTLVTAFGHADVRVEVEAVAYLAGN